MAVYTIINKQLLESFLDNYELGELISFEGIREGVENTNYKLNMSSGIYILTIFEKRVEIEELPFFVELMNHLSKKQYKCPIPISDTKGEQIIKIKKIGILVGQS